MHEPITLVRRRGKDGKPGDWEILVGPQQPMIEHLAAHRKAVAGHPQHEEYAAIRVARLEDVTRTVVFKTEAELKAEAKRLEAFAAKQAQTIEDAAQRQKKLDADKAAKEEELRKAKIAEMNKMHDAIREQPKK